MSRTRTWTRLVEDKDLDSDSGCLRLELGLVGLDYNTVKTSVRRTQRLVFNHFTIMYTNMLQQVKTIMEREILTVDT